MRPIDADALGNRLYHEVFEKDSEDQRWDSGCWMRYRLFEKVLREQPTIEQPEIIRCQDCEYWMPYDWMFSEVWKSKNMEDYPENEIGCAYADMSMSATDFCSRSARREVSE